MDLANPGFYKMKSGVLGIPGSPPSKLRYFHQNNYSRQVDFLIQEEIQEIRMRIVWISS